MSSDNFYYVDKVNDKYRVTMQFASDDNLWFGDEERWKMFDALGEAMKYGMTEYSEYGVQTSPEIEMEDWF